MNRQAPLVIKLPPLSDSSVVQLHRCLAALINVFESSYDLQLWRHYQKQPEHERPAKFSGEPF